MKNPFDTGYWFTEDLLNFGFQSIGSNVKIAKNCTVIGLANISIGNNVRIDGPSVISAAGGYLRIGSYVHIGGMCFLAGGGGLTFDDFSGVSQGVRIYSASDDYSGNALTNPTVPSEFTNVKKAPVRLGRHVIIGSGSVVLPGCDVGDGCSVGALSLVSKSLDPWGVYFGSPVKKIKRRSRQILDLEIQLTNTSSAKPIALV